MAHLDPDDGQRLQPALHRMEAQIHRDLGTILAEGEQRETRSHGSRAPDVREAQAMTDVRQAKSLGHKELDALAVKLAGGALEQPAGQLCGEEDGSRLSDNERRPRRLREDIFQVPGQIHGCSETQSPKFINILAAGQVPKYVNLRIVTL